MTVLLVAGCGRKAPSLVMASSVRDTIVPGCWQITRGEGDLVTGATLCFLERTYVLTTPDGSSDSRAIRWQESSPMEWDGVVQEGTPDGRLRVVSDHRGAAALEVRGSTLPLARPAAFDPDAALARARAMPTADEMCRRATRCAEATDRLLGTQSFVNDAHTGASLAMCRNEIAGIEEVLARMPRAVPAECR